MIPYNSHLYATIQDRPIAGVLRVVGWNAVTGLPYLINIKTKDWQRLSSGASVAADEWNSEHGILIFHDTRREADAELDRMINDVHAVIAEAKQITREAAR